MHKLLIANRGEIAVRIARTARELQIATVAIFPQDDDLSPHVKFTDHAVQISGRGPAAYLGMVSVLDAAIAEGCDAIHPGYGFLSENADFARACAERGVTFVGPSPNVLEQFGDKAQARALARTLGAPILQGTDGTCDAEGAKAFFHSLQGRAMLIKAAAGGGGRGIRLVREAHEIDDAFAHCRAEALAAFGDDRLYAEEFFDCARHIEVQVIADGLNAVTLGDRDCSLQRRNQKLIEIAPAPDIAPAVRAEMRAIALRITDHVAFKGVGTFEFLLDRHSERFVFLEINPRLQVEHTITEEVWNLDIVEAQLRIAAGATLSEIGLSQNAVAPRGCAIQLRINAETLAEDGTPTMSLGTITALDPATGPGIRYDGYAEPGYRLNPYYDSLIAKLIIRHPSNDLAPAVARAVRAAHETRIAGVRSNLALHRAILAHPDFLARRTHTRWIDERAGALAATAAEYQDMIGDEAWEQVALDNLADPLEPGIQIVAAPGVGVVSRLVVSPGEIVSAGEPLVVVEVMKMETEVLSSADGCVSALLVAPGDTVVPGQPIAAIKLMDGVPVRRSSEGGGEIMPPSLAELIDRRYATLDAARPHAVERQHERGHRTARENVADLCDEGSFAEIGQLVVAAQRSVRPLEELFERTPADGVITGIGDINGGDFATPASRCAVLAYDCSVLAGTQGINGHRKIDRLFRIAAEAQMPVVAFLAGGGGRPGDVDFPSGFDSWAFADWPALSGKVPLVGVCAGYCFAGNAGLLGMTDVIIATRNSTIGMAGPALVEGAGLGSFKPEEIGPAPMHWRNGVVDVLVADDAEAVATACRYLSYFQGRISHWTAPDADALRSIVPDNPRRGYRMIDIVNGIADVGSVLELRSGFGPGVISALMRIEGRPIGVIANNPLHLGGAIDADGADKASRFVRLCDTFGLPILSLIDNPGIMVGPEAEKTGLVRHASRLFIASANVQVPFVAIQIRKAYGLGGIAMCAGAYRRPMSALAWPTAECGNMGIEASVALGNRAKLSALPDAEAKAFFQAEVSRLYREGRAINAGSAFKFDEVIDPAETRWRLTRIFDAVRPPSAAPEFRSGLDPW